MKFPPARFNIIFSLLALLLAAGGCKSSEERQKNKEATSIYFHIETNPDGTHYTGLAQVYRANPVKLAVATTPALDEGFIKSAELVDVDEHGGYAIKIIFDEAGARRLDNLTIEHRGKRLAISARWTETRWLGAPLINRRISDGIFIFTPDATREEAQRIVSGLNNSTKALKKPYTILG